MSTEDDQIKGVIGCFGLIGIFGGGITLICWGLHHWFGVPGAWVGACVSAMAVGGFLFLDSSRK